MFKRKTESSDVPVVFVPGLFGSMSDEILPGTGDWHFGLAGMIYEPFVKRLSTKLGYIEGEDLFIAFYDWRQSIEYNAETYLAQTIEKAKSTSGSKKVHLLCHSMGGLVARAYAQKSGYTQDIEQLILMCTPNCGSPPNFSYWTGGRLPGGSGEKVNLVRMYMDAYLWLLPKIHHTNELTAIHESFPGLADLIPNKAFGSYLVKKDQEIGFEYKSYSDMKTKNVFLDKLDQTVNRLKRRKLQTTLIAGFGEETIEFLKVVPSKSSTHWVDGRVIESYKTEFGDGNALVRSVFSIPGERYLLKGSHNEVLLKAFPILEEKLKRESVEEGCFRSSKEYVFVLLGQGEVSVKGDRTGEGKSIVPFEGGWLIALSEEAIKNARLEYAAHEEETVEYLILQQGQRKENQLNVKPYIPLSINEMFRQHV